MHAGNVFLHLFISFVTATCGVLLLIKAKKIFRNLIPYETVRRNLVALIIIELFHWGLAPLIPDFTTMLHRYGFMQVMLLYSGVAGAASLIVYNVAYFVTGFSYFKDKSFFLHQLGILFSIIFSTILVFLAVNYYFNNYSTKYFTLSIAWSFYFSGLVGSINLIINYINRESQQKEKLRELELSKLNELKIQAELDALQSKINPHFLYNSLNSIADLTITNSIKAREMTLALSDLFRYSINNTNTIFNTVADELKIIETYLNIERVRFEEKLSYEINAEPDVVRHSIPKFLLQPLVENAVKHGLKNNLRLEIKIDVTCEDKELTIYIFDNGTPFPEDITPGYGMKNVIEKLRLIYPDKHELAFLNEPQKHVLIRLKAAQ